MDHTAFQTIRFEIEDSIAVITLNDPEKRNAISPEMVDELHRALDALEQNDAVRALVIWGGNEKFFCAGGDIGAMLGMDVRDGYAISRRSHKLYNRIESLRMPTVALLGGFTFGGGFELSLACDFRIANEKLKLGLTEVSLGLIPGGGGTCRLPRLIGAAKAKELMFLGKVIDAQEAERLDLVMKVVPVGTLYVAGMAFARELAQKAPLPLELMKTLIGQNAGASHETACEMESRSFSTLFASEDAKEGMRAFLEKRAPVYQGK